MVVKRNVEGASQGFCTAFLNLHSCLYKTRGIEDHKGLDLHVDDAL